MLIWFYCLLFFLGAVFGSFWWVIIERWREGFARADWKRVFGGRSYCPSCKETLTRWQLIPLVGRLIQKGKCFRCKLQIPVRYMWEEILMGLVFVVTGWMTIWTDLALLAEHSESLRLLFWLILNRWLVLLLMADLLRYELNMYVRILLMIVIVFFQAMWRIGDLQTMILGWVILSCVFYGIYLGAARWQTRKMWQFTEWFWLGDVRMAWLVGACAWIIFNWLDWIMRTQIVLWYLTLSSGLWILFWLLRKWILKSNEAQMPFIPAMIIAFGIFWFRGEIIISKMSIWL